MTFATCFLWIFAGAAYVEAHHGNKALAGALSAISAAVVGLILNLSIWFALRTLFRESAAVRGGGLFLMLGDGAGAVSERSAYAMTEPLFPICV